MATAGRIRTLIAAAGVSLALGLAAPAHAQVDLARARLVTLTNGLRVLLVPDSMATALEVSSWFDAGTGNETPGHPGITRVIERLVSRGAAGSDRSRRVAAEGGLAGSLTLPDAVCFFETLPAGALELGFQIAAERMKPLAVSAAELDAERARLRDGQRDRGAGGPGVRGLERLHAALYPAVSARPPVSGPDADLSRITARDCEDDFRARFAPNRAFVIVAGRFDPERALDLARTWLQPVPRRPGPPVRPVAAAAVRDRRVTEPLDLDLRLFFVGWRAPGKGSADAVPLDLLGRILGSGPDSRLAREAVGPDHDLLFGQAGYEGRRESGMFFAYGALRPGVDSAAVEKDLIARIETLAAEPVGAEELERVKRQAECAALFAWQTMQGRAMALGAAQLVEGDFQGAWRQLGRIRASSAADLQRAAARMLKTQTRSVVWLVPSAAVRAAQGAEGGR